MAVFENEARLKKGTRSNTKLIISGGMSPAEQFIVDPSLPAKFVYEYGGPGQKDVVIPKGAVVGILPEAQLDYETGKTRSILTFAGKDGAKAVGVAPYNYTKHTNDFLDGNLPALITREYIELPFGVDKAKVEALQYGAVYALDLKIGDLVTYSKEASLFGKVVKAQEGDEIVGQVLAMEADAQTQGWLKWAMWDEAAKLQDKGQVDKTGYSAPGIGGFPFDPAYAEGLIDQPGYLDIYTTTATGVPGLLDGQARTKTIRTQKATLLAANSVYALIDQEIVEGSVLIDGFTSVGTLSDVVAETFFVDHKSGQIHYKTAADKAGVDITYKAHAYGTPAHLDFDGVLGACRILLRF